MLIRHDKEFTHDASIIQQLVTQGFVIGTLNENFPAERINDPWDWQNAESYLQTARQLAPEDNVVQANLKRWAEMKEEGKDTHTSLKGAHMNAKSIADGLKMADCPLKQYLK